MAVSNTRDEIYDAIRDCHAGRMGTIPAVWLGAGDGAAPNDN